MSLLKGGREGGVDEWANGRRDGGSKGAKDDPPSAQTNGRRGEIMPATKPYLH